MTDEKQLVENTANPETDSKDSASPVLVVFLVLPLLGIIAALLIVANDIRNQQATNEQDIFASSNPAALINSLAPEFELTDLNGQAVALSEYRGKILFLNFWQTTCPPCIEEMPDFIEFMSDQPDDVTWLTVNFDETDQLVREFFASYDLLGIPTVMDYDSSVRYQYGVFGAPVTFVIDAEGVIQYMNIGQLTYNEMEELAALVRNGA